MKKPIEQLEKHRENITNDLNALAANNGSAIAIVAKTSELKQINQNIEDLSKFGEDGKLETK